MNLVSIQKYLVPLSVSIVLAISAHQTLLGTWAEADTVNLLPTYMSEATTPT